MRREENMTIRGAIYSFGIMLLSAMTLFGEGGMVVREYWTGIQGTAVADLTGAAAYPGSPSGTARESAFEVSRDFGDSFGAKVWGYITAPTDGEYVFRISGSDAGELWLSTDDDPANARKIASFENGTAYREWDKYATQESSPVELVADETYYIHALHKAGSGEDHLSVGWTLPDGTDENPIAPDRFTSLEAPENYAEWDYSTTIEIDTRADGANIGTDQTDFPLLIRLGTDEQVVFDNAQENGEDIRFVAENGTPLSYEIEIWDRTNSSAAIWVRVPLIQGEDVTRISMYWGNADALSQSNGSSVFLSGNGFAAVHHMDGSLSDAVGNNRGLANLNMPSENTIDGLIGKATQFDASAYMTMEAFTWGESWTVSGWLRHNMGDADQALCGSEHLQVWRDDNAEDRYGVALKEGDSWSAEYGSIEPDESNGYLVSAVHDNGTTHLYVNGVLEATLDGVTLAGGEMLNLGRSNETNSKKLDGIIDEFRVATQVRSTDWLKLSYETQKPGTDAVRIGIAPNSPKMPSNVVASGAGSSISVSWSDESSDEDGFSVYTGSSAAQMVHVADVGANSTSYTHQIGNCGAVRYYAVAAYSGSGVSPRVTTSAQAYTDPCIPGNVSASGESETEISVQWSGTAPEYVVEGRNSGAAWTELYRGSGNSFRHQALTCGTEWEYRVAAVVPQNRVSAFSSSATATTLSCALPAPTNLTADAGAPDQVVLQWTNNATGATGLNVYRKRGDDAFQTLVENLPSDANSYTDNNVDCDTEYSYYVQATDGSGVSDASNTATANTPYCGAGRTTTGMVSVVGMLLDGDGNAVTGIEPTVTVKLYADPDAVDPVYTESYNDVAVRNGFLRLALGLSDDVAPVIRAHESLYYDIIANGTSLFDNTYQPMTAAPYTLKNAFNLHGEGSPTVAEPTAPVGATYMDTDAKVLYVKYGPEDDAWLQVGQ